MWAAGDWPAAHPPSDSTSVSAVTEVLRHAEVAFAADPTQNVWAQRWYRLVHL